MWVIIWKERYTFEAKPNMSREAYEVGARHEDGETAVRCGTNGFKVGVGLHQGTTLSPFLFALVMDMLTDKVRQESLWIFMTPYREQPKDKRKQINHDI